MMKRSNIQPLALLLALMFVLLPGCAETGTAEISEDVYAAAGDGQIVDIRDRYTADVELHGSDAGAPVQTLLLDNAEDNDGCHPKPCLRYPRTRTRAWALPPAGVDQAKHCM